MKYMKTKRIVLCALIGLLTATALTFGSCVGHHGGEENTTTEATEMTEAPTGKTDPDETTASDDAESVRVTFVDTAGVHYEGDFKSGKQIEKGKTLSFSLRISPFYEGTPTVYADDSVLEADGEGKYTLTVNADTEIRTEGITRKASSMEGDGTSEDSAFQVTSAVDLLYIAEQVNAGNTVYSGAYYALQNDIDFQGESMDVIGNGNSDDAVFCGVFNGNGYTVKNYVMETDDVQYVGLFGVLQSNVAGSDGGTVYKLNLRDFRVTASVSGMGCFCGSLVGYGMGGNLFQCNAENGVIEMHADYNAFSYVGGLIGLQQALDFNSFAYYSQISYCVTDVEVNCNSGSVIAAGGIVGYMIDSEEGVPAFMNNCYATGPVRGAMRAGGVVGHMASGTSIIDCYATGDVSAQAFATDATNSEAYCYAYAGGVVGYADPDCVISESFSASKLQAKAKLGQAYEVTGGVLAHAEEPGAYDFGSSVATVYNCCYAAGGTDGDIRLTAKEYLKDNLHWNPIDWVFEEGAYPVINTEESAYTFTVLFDFGGDLLNEEAQFGEYRTLFYWYAEGELPSRLVGDEEAGDLRAAYGYFFDAAYTQPIPDSFVPTHDMTIYAAVADTTSIVGTYHLLVTGTDAPLTLTFYANGTFAYTDAGQTTLANYRYDGTRLFLEDVRLARYGGDASWGKYQLFTFCAEPGDGILTIWGGVYEDEDTNETVIYYTEEAPLIAVSAKKTVTGKYFDGQGVYTFYADGTGNYLCQNSQEDLTYTRNGSDLQVTVGKKTYKGTVSEDGALTLDAKVLAQTDAFVGSWTVDSKAHKVYTFDGFGNWSYLYYGFRQSSLSVSRIVYEKKAGTYTVDADGVLTMSGDFTATARFSDNALCIEREEGSLTCHRDGSCFGTWVYADYGLTLTLGGVGVDGQGSARVEYVHENGTVEFYDLLYALDDTDSSYICLYYNGEVFGYLTYIPARETLRAMMYVGTMNSLMNNVHLERIDEYSGDWIGSDDLLPLLSFDGNGSYKGSLQINGETVSYSLDEATLTGSFVYQGVVYLLSFDEVSNRMTLTVGTTDTVYQRKDLFGDLILANGTDGTLYTFDGRGALAGAGSMTVLATDGSTQTYTYRMSGEDLILWQGDTVIGGISTDADKREYVLTLAGTSCSLRVQSKFTGTWAMSGSLTDMTVGLMDIDGKMPGVVNNTDVTFTLESDGTLSFFYKETQYYAIFVGEENLILSQHKDWYLYTDQIMCAREDELFGTWKNELDAAYRFDGMSGSTLTSGAAQSGILANGDIANSTSFAYSYQDGRYILWTVDETTGETQIYRLVFCDKEEKNAYINGDRAFVIEKGDRLYKMEALDQETGKTYSFDGFGKVTVSDGNVYTYKVTSIDYENGIANAEMTADGVVYTVTIDYNTEQATMILTEKA